MNQDHANTIIKKTFKLMMTFNHNLQNYYNNLFLVEVFFETHSNP